MKRILIFSHAMELGGAERALLGMLEHLDYEKYAVDLFLMRHTGELLSYIPKQVNLLPEISQYACLAVPIKRVLKQRHFLIAAGRVIGKSVAKHSIRNLQLPAENGVTLEYSHKYTKWCMPDIQPNKEYDLAISFLTPHYFVAEKVCALKKVAWIHTDYEKVKVDIKSESAMWNRYDFIASISEGVSQSFCSVFPSLKSKLRVIGNVMPIDCIMEQSTEAVPTEEMISDGSIKLLSIGRFCNAKNFDNVPEICSKILKQGMNVKWYLIGFGNDEELIRKKITEYGMQNYVFILGKKENPYPYIKACDIYIQPSRYEGNSVCVHEAQILGKPVIITKYPTSASQLEEGVDGIIVPMDIEGCASGVVQIINNRELQKYLSVNCAKRDYSNASEIEKIYQLIEEN